MEIASFITNNLGECFITVFIYFIIYLFDNLFILFFSYIITFNFNSIFMLE